MSSTVGITGNEIRDETITDLQISDDADISELKLLFNLITGHNHNGVNSRLVSGGTGSDLVVDSSFTGSVNSSNTVFTLSANYLTNTVAVYVSGVRQKRGVHFNETAPNQITFTTAPPTGRVLVFDFVSA